MFQLTWFSLAKIVSLHTRLTGINHNTVGTATWLRFPFVFFRSSRRRLWQNQNTYHYSFLLSPTRFIIYTSRSIRCYVTDAIEKLLFTTQEWIGQSVICSNRNLEKVVQSFRSRILLRLLKRHAMKLHISKTSWHQNWKEVTCRLHNPEIFSPLITTVIPTSLDIATSKAACMI
jgi:hypothetical protein